LMLLEYRIVDVLVAECFCLSFVAYTCNLTRLQAELKSDRLLRTEIVRSIAAFVAPVLIVLLGGGRSWAAVLFGTATGYLIAFAYSIRFVGEGTRNENTVPTTKTPKAVEPVHGLKEIWSYGWAMGLWLLLVQALPVIDRSMIQNSFGDLAAGTYSSLYEVAV